MPLSLSPETHPRLPSGLGVALSPPHLLPNGLASPPSLPGLRPQLLPPHRGAQESRGRPWSSPAPGPRARPPSGHSQNPAASQLEARLPALPITSSAPTRPAGQPLLPSPGGSGALASARPASAAGQAALLSGPPPLPLWAPSARYLGLRLPRRAQACAEQTNSCSSTKLLPPSPPPLRRGGGLQPIARSPAYRGGWALWAFTRQSPGERRASDGLSPTSTGESPDWRGRQPIPKREALKIDGISSH